jgi:hypothetical protein
MSIELKMRVSYDRCPICEHVPTCSSSSAPDSHSRSGAECAVEVVSHTPLVPARTDPQFMMHSSRPGQRTSRDREHRETPHGFFGSSDASLVQQRSSVAPGSGSSFTCTNLKHHYEHGYQVQPPAAVSVAIAIGGISMNGHVPV